MAEIWEHGLIMTKKKDKVIEQSGRLETSLQFNQIFLTTLFMSISKTELIQMLVIILQFTMKTLCTIKQIQQVKVKCGCLLRRDCKLRLTFPMDSLGDHFAVRFCLLFQISLVNLQVARITNCAKRTTGLRVTVGLLIYCN